MFDGLKPSNLYIHVVTRKTPYPQPALGKAIRKLRSEREISLGSFAPEGRAQREHALADRAWRANPTWETVKGIATALDVSIADLAKLSLKFEDSSQK